jgi:hypothetical protein
MKAARRLIDYFVALARELSDEGAYARHLQLNGREHSAAEWRVFIDARNRRKYRNGKCC